MTERGFWVYAVAGQYAGEDLSGLDGVGDGRVRVIGAAGLAVLASDVDLAEFGAEALRRNLEDLDWLERVAWAHHHVIDAAARLLPLLPMRLATVYASEGTAAAAFTERAAELRDALAQVRGRAEWGVKAYARPAREVSARDKPAPAGAESGTAESGTGGTGTGGTGPGGAGAGSGAGTAYLKRRRDQLSAQRDTQRDAVASARAVHSALAGHAALSRLHPPQSAQLSGDRAPMLLNASYLLDAGDGTAFTSVLEAAASTHPDLRLELTGPWPPYSFAGGDAQ